jgi:hypothetical protein
MFAQPSLVHEDTSCYLGTLNNAKGAVVSFNFTHQDTERLVVLEIIRPCNVRATFFSS